MPSLTGPSPRAYAALYALALVSAWWIGPDGPIYWDSFGYVIQSITGRVGGLMLGRPTFVLASHATSLAWRALGGSVTSVEPLLRAQWMLVSALGAPALAWVASLAGLSVRASLAAGFFLALSPTVAHSSSAVLTDAPSMAVTLVASGLAWRAMREASPARMLAAGLALGVAAGMREQAITHLTAFIALSYFAERRRLTLALTASIGALGALTLPVAWIALHQRSYLASLGDWGRSMAGERAQHTYGARDFAMFVVWIAASGLAPLAGLVGALARGWRPTTPSRPLLAFVGLSGLQLAALAFYQDIAFSPRYLLGALPVGLVLPCAIALDAAWAMRRLRIAVLVSAVAIAAGAGPLMRRLERPLREGLASLPSRLAVIAPNAAVVTGQLCPAVVYHRELARLAPSRTPPSWVQVCPGWRWPPRLVDRLDALRGEGHPVVIDLRTDSWVGERQLRCRTEADAYARQHPNDVTTWR